MIVEPSFPDAKAEVDAGQRMKSKEKTKRTHFRRLVDWLQSPLTLVAAWGILYSLFPHLTTSDLVQMDAQSAFSYRMDVKNDGPLPVFSVQSSLSPTDIKTKQGGGLQAPHGARLSKKDDCCASTLFPGDSYTFTTETLGILPADIVTADFTVYVSYIPLFPPLRMNTCAHFRSYRDVAGTLHWFRSPAHCRPEWLPAWFPWTATTSQAS